MKISIIVQGRWHAFDLARELSKLGHLGQLITTYPTFEVVKYGVPRESVVSLISTELVRRVSWHTSPKIVNFLAPHLVKVFAKQAARHLAPCDVVIAWSGAGTPAFNKAKDWNCLRVSERCSSHIREQEIILAEEHRLQGLPWKPWGEKGLKLDLDDYANSDMVEIPSLFVKRSFLKHGYPEERLNHLPYGVNLEQFKPSTLPVEKFRVVYAGSLSLRKGIGYLSQAFLKATMGDSELWFIGAKTAETDQLLKVSDPRIKLLGHFPQADLVKLYNQCSVFVMPSVEEGLAYVQAQALACGLPLICTTNTGGEDLLRMTLGPDQEPLKISDEIEQYPAGFVVPIRRPDCITRCLELLYENPQLLASMRAAALNFSQSKLDWENYARNLVQKYQGFLLNSNFSSIQKA